MGLTLPVVSVTLGPTYASDNNAAFEDVDAHDHSSGKGVQVPSAGLNINGNVDWDANSITDLGSADFSAQLSALSSGSRRIFSYAGELYYRDAVGNNVRLTLAGSVDGSGSGAITGLSPPAIASYTSATKQFGLFFDTAKQASIQHGDLLIFPFDGSAQYTNFTTIKASTALASNFTLTLPTALPATKLPLVSSSAGALSFDTELQLGNGSAGSPSYSFSGDTNTGMYNTGTADTIGWTTGGTLRLSLNTTSLTSTLPFYAAVGSASTPIYTFTTDTNTGIYHSGADEIGFAVGGSAVFRADVDGLSMFTGAQLIGDDGGTAAAPAFTFAGDVDTGMYRTAANSIGLSTNGVIRATINSTGLTLAGVNLSSNGTQSAPTYSFAGDTGTGMYYPSTNTLGFSTNSTLRAYIDSTGFICRAINTQSGGPVAFYTETGSLTTGANTTLTVTGTILSFTGEYVSGTDTFPIGGTSEVSGVHRLPGAGSAAAVKIVNSDGSTRSYKAVIAYIPS